MNSRNMVLNTIYISPQLDDKLRVEAFDRRVSQSDLIRHYIELGMKAAEESAAGARLRRGKRQLVRRSSSRVVNKKK